MNVSDGVVVIMVEEYFAPRPCLVCKKPIKLGDECVRMSWRPGFRHAACKPKNDKPPPARRDPFTDMSEDEIRRELMTDTPLPSSGRRVIRKGETFS